MKGPFQFECLTRDIPGSEGPCVTRDGRIFMVGPDQGRIVEALPKGATRDLVNTRGIPAGLQLDRNGDLWVADMKLGILRVTMKGEVIPEVALFDGKPMRGCNDCAFDSQGNLYFTAPAGSSQANRVGEIYCRLRSGEVIKLDQGFAFSNGIAVSADDQRLIVAETFTKSLWSYKIAAPGEVSDKRLWGILPGNHYGGPDGMDFDQEGYLLVAHWGGGAIEVFAPNGAFEQSLQTPFAKPSNVHFKGEGSNILLITEHDTHGLWQIDYGKPGQKQYGW